MLLSVSVQARLQLWKGEDERKPAETIGAIRLPRPEKIVSDASSFSEAGMSAL